MTAIGARAEAGDRHQPWPTAARGPSHLRSAHMTQGAAESGRRCPVFTEGPKPHAHTGAPGTPVQMWAHTWVRSSMGSSRNAKSEREFLPAIRKCHDCFRQGRIQRLSKLLVSVSVCGSRSHSVLAWLPSLLVSLCTQPLCGPKDGRGSWTPRLSDWATGRGSGRSLIGSCFQVSCFQSRGAGFLCSDWPSQPPPSVRAL